MMAFSFSEEDEAAYYFNQKLVLTGRTRGGCESKEYFEFPAITKNHQDRHKCANCGEFSHNIMIIEDDHFCAKDCASSFYMRQGGFPETPIVSPTEKTRSGGKKATRARRPTIMLESAYDGSTYFKYSVLI